MRASRMESVQTPIIPVVGQLIKDNPGTISLGQGVVSYPPPREAIDSLSLFFQDSENHKYKAVRGIPPLIEAITAKIGAENGVKLGDNRTIVVTAGSNMAFVNALLAITGIGDEIILNAPYYFNHEMAIRMGGCHPVIVNTDGDYLPDLNALAKAVTARTRAIVTVSPNNPTGAVYSEAILRKINALCRERGIYHIHDETYEYFTYDGIEHFSPSSIENAGDYTISLFSLSKAYGFAGWRIGYMVIPEELLESIEKIQDTIVICPPVISQYAALGALQAGREYCRYYLAGIEENRRVCLSALKSVDDRCSVSPAVGAFYFFLKINSENDDFELVKKLIEKYKVALLPGSTFGTGGGCYLRLAYGALNRETVLTAMERLVKGLREIT